MSVICQQYKQINECTSSQCLYELLSQDENVTSLYKILKSESKLFSSVLNAFEGILDENQLIALIDLINLAEKDGIGLFDLKYHSFVRPLSGAYVTFDSEQKLSLAKTNIIDGFKAFERGNCSYCNAPHIIGRIQCNEEDKLDYLYQNKEVDIYKNYGDICFEILFYS